VGWSFHEDEVDLHADVGRLVLGHFGLDVKIHSHAKYGDKSVQVCAYGVEIACFFDKHGGRNAAQKVMSSWVWGLSASSRMELLVGWLLGDGHARSAKSEVMGGTVSPHLVTQMFLLALSVGLRPYYIIRPEGETTFPNRKVSPSLPFHCITFYGDDADMLARRMGVHPPDRSKTKIAGFFHGGLFWRRVRNVQRRYYKGPVYNMHTSTDEYVAGLLLTHNCFGHWHKDQGIQEIAKDKWAVNLGSLSRGALIQDDLDRVPSCAILTFTEQGVEIEQRVLKVRPSNEVFNIERAGRAKKRTMAVDVFASSLKETLITRTKGSLLDAIRQMDAPNSVRERAISYLEQAGAR
jgi:hypothetical protein